MMMRPGAAQPVAGAWMTLAGRAVTTAADPTRPRQHCLSGSNMPADGDNENDDGERKIHDGDGGGDDEDKMLTLMARAARLCKRHERDSGEDSATAE